VPRALRRDSASMSAARRQRNRGTPRLCCSAVRYPVPDAPACYIETLYVKDFGRTLSNTGCCSSWFARREWSFLRQWQSPAPAPQAPRAGNFPRQSSPTPPLPDAAPPHQTPLRPPSAAAPSRAAHWARMPLDRASRPHQACTLWHTLSSTHWAHTPSDTIARLIEEEERGLQLPGSLLPLRAQGPHPPWDLTVVVLKVFVKMSS
jgi:hypothetical protein